VVLIDLLCKFNLGFWRKYINLQRLESKIRRRFVVCLPEKKERNGNNISSLFESSPLKDSFPMLFKFSEDKNKVSELGSWADMVTKVA